MPTTWPPLEKEEGEIKTWAAGAGSTVVTFAALFMLATLVCRGVAGGGCFGGQPLALDCCWIMMPSNTSDRLTSKPRQQQQRISSDEGNKWNDNEDKCNKGSGKKVEGNKDKDNKDAGEKVTKTKQTMVDAIKARVRSVQLIRAG